MDWKNIVSTVAPWIGTALGGPLGGAAVGAIADALGLSEKTEASIKSALSGVTPEQMLAIKNADQAFALKMQELGYAHIKDMESLASGDRSDARDMQKMIRSNVPAILSIAITMGYFFILIGMMQGWLKVSDSQALILMLGSLSTGWGVVMAFWFGTTHDSGRKTEIIAQSTPPK
jgi:hypothetical protein